MSPATYAAQRSRFVDNSITTASPARLLIMLYDRLLLDLLRAETAQEAGDRVSAGKQLLHAQEIVLELACSLRTDEWVGAAGLSALYGFLHTELVQANITGEAQRTRQCREIVEPLAEAWRAAALDVSAQLALADRAS